MNIRRYTDTWGGRNYGCFPISTPGQSLKERLDKSPAWELMEETRQIDERNDNQLNIHRATKFLYKHVTGERLRVHMARSRSGKTVSWEFHYSSPDAIFLSTGFGS